MRVHMGTPSARFSACLIKILSKFQQSIKPHPSPLNSASTKSLRPPLLTEPGGLLFINDINYLKKFTFATLVFLGPIPV